MGTDLREESVTISSLGMSLEVPATEGLSGHIRLGSHERGIAKLPYLRPRPRHVEHRGRRRSHFSLKEAQVWQSVANLRELVLFPWWEIITSETARWSISFFCMCLCVCVCDVVENESRCRFPPKLGINLIRWYLRGIHRGIHRGTFVISLSLCIHPSLPML